MKHFLQMVRLLVITTLLFVLAGHTHLSWGQTTVGPSFAGAGADVTGVGTVSWTNPGRVTANDNSYATVTIDGSTSHYLQTTNYGFSIPSNAVINGITVTIGRYGTVGGGQDVRDNVVSLVKAGVITGSNYAVTGTDWIDTESVLSYGDAANLWGTSWTPADINASNFGVALAVNSTKNRTAYVDYIQLTVSYVIFTTPWVITTAGASNFTVPAGVSCIQVEAWGGGGRGGSRSNGSGGYGGGGGGAYSRNVLTVIPGNTYPLYTGAGSTTTASGEDSYFINNTTLLAKGGGSVPNNSGTGASGGAAANGYGDVKWSGGNGANGVAGSYGGGGGSSAGSALNGNTATNATGATAPSGGGNGGNGKTGTSGNGSPGIAPGGGGGGALRTGGGAVGGNGADGQIIITWGSLTSTNTPVVSSPIFSDAASISGTSEANAVVVVYSGGSTQIGTGTANGSGVWSATVSALTTGQSITATAKVVDKCLSSESAPVIVSAAPPITTGTISPTTFCAGSAVNIPYTISVTFTAGNVFTAQLSDAGGSFTTPVTLGTLTSIAAGTISGTIPSGTSTGTAYRIRVVSSNPAATGIDNGVNLTVNATPPAPTVGTITQPTCTVATGSVDLSGLPSGTWILNPGSISGSGSSTTLSGLVAGTYNFTVTNSSGCVSTASGNVVINTQPSTPFITGTSPGALCGAGSVILSATTSAGTINWYDASTGGSSLGTGTTFTTPVLSSSTSYYVDATFGGCTSTPRMAVLASIIPAASIAAGGAGTFCSGTTITLTSSGTNLTNQYWQGPDSFYSILQNPALSTATTAMSGTYTVTGSSLSGINLVTNGDFEAGNTGFGSSYGYVAPAANVLTPEGLYTIVANPNSVHDGYTNCANHTPAGALQMVINGAVVAGMNVWSQTVNVVPNTDYQFTYWQQSVVAGNPSQLQLFVNTVSAGPTYTAITATCQWIKFVYNWNSGSSTTAYLSLENQNTIAGGNDFTLDDIVFEQVCSTTSSVDVTVNADVTAGEIGSMQSVCRGYTPATLSSVTAGTGSGAISYEWQTNASGSFVTISGATADAYSPPALIATTIYQRRTVSLSGGATCYSPYTTQITITVTGPVAMAGGPDTVCQAASAFALSGASFSGGATSAAWSIISGGGTLSSTAQTATPETVTYTPEVNYSGTVILRLTTAGGSCAAIAERTITINICINKWKGTISSNWNISGNWALNYVPAVDDNIIFDDAPVNHCLLDQDRSVTDITNAQATYRLVTNGYKLTLKGNLNFSNGARIDASNTNSSVELAGASAQVIPAGTFYTDEVYNLIVNNANHVSLNGTLRLLNSLSATSGLLDAMTNSPNVIYAGTVSQTIGSQFLNDEMFHLTVDNSAGLTLNSNFILSNDLVINAGKLFSIAAGKTLSVSGAINNSAGSAGFVLQSDASGTASLIHHVDNVQATVNRYISGTDEAWHFLSSPVSNQNIDGSWLPSGTYGNGTGYDLYAWNEPTYCWIYKLNTTSAVNWNTVHPGSNFEAGRGYLYSNQVSGTTKAFLGNLNNGPVSYSLTTSSTDLSLKGFNLIGNPYPSSIDWQTPTGWSRSDLLNSGGGYDMWIWNPTADNYGVFNSLSGVGTNDVIRYIAPMQGYFVRAASAGNLGTDNSVRIHDGTGAWKSAKINQEMLSLVVRPATGTSCDETRIMFGYEASQSGAAKLFSPVVTAPSLYLPSGSENYSVRYLTDTIDNPFIPVMFKAGTDGTYTLSCSFDENIFKTVLLKDRQKNIRQNLNVEKTYRFKASTLDDPDRFVLYFKPVTTGSEKELPVRIYTDGIGLIVDLRLISQETEVSVYDLLGRKLLEKNLQGGSRHTLDLKSVTQILIVCVKNQNGSLSQKLFWGN